MTATRTLYLIEDDRSILRFVLSTLDRRPSWSLLGVSETFEHAQENAAHSCADVYLVDLGLPDGRGEDMLRELSLHCPSSELLVFTVFGDETRLLKAIQCGATGYVIKGCTPEALIAAIEAILSGSAPMSPLLAKRLLALSSEKRGSAGDDLAGRLNIIDSRDSDVLKKLSLGYTPDEIGEESGLDQVVVGSVIKNLYRKFASMSRELGAR